MRANVPNSALPLKAKLSMSSSLLDSDLSPLPDPLLVHLPELLPVVLLLPRPKLRRKSPRKKSTWEVFSEEMMTTEQLGTKLISFSQTVVI